MLALASLKTEFGNKYILAVIWIIWSSWIFQVCFDVLRGMIYHEVFFLVFLFFSTLSLDILFPVLDGSWKYRAETTEMQIIGEVSGLVKYSKEKPDILCVSGNIICILFFARKAIFFVWHSYINLA